MTVAVVFFAVIAMVQAVPVRPVKVAVPVPVVDGVTAFPLMVNVLVTDWPVPPDHVTVHPVKVTLDAAGLVMGVGGARTVTLFVTAPLALVVVMTTFQAPVAPPVRPVKVAEPAARVEGGCGVPLIAKVLVVAVPLPPVQFKVNPLAVMAVAVRPVMGVGGASTVS